MRRLSAGLSSLKRGGRRKRPIRIDYKHHELVENCRAGAGELHRQIGTVTVHCLARFDMGHPMRSTLAEPTAKHVEGFRSRVGMDRCHRAGRAAGAIDPQQVSVCAENWHRSDCSDLCAAALLRALWRERKQPGLTCVLGGER